MKRRATIYPINEYSYCIDDAGESCCYVICGKEKAALIDTANGWENLYEVVREITDLPIMVINTHGHCDHVYGNTFFEEAWIHPADEALHNAHFADKTVESYEQYAGNGCTREEFLVFQAAKPCKLNYLNPGDVVSLGELDLLVVDLKGHTAGSIGLLDEQSGDFYSGDGINKGQFWMQLLDSLSLEEYAQTLRNLAPIRNRIKVIHGGHSVKGYEPEFIDMMLNGVQAVIAAKGEGDTTCEWFLGVSPAHELPDGTLILYDKKKITAE